MMELAVPCRSGLAAGSLLPYLGWEKSGAVYRPFARISSSGAVSDQMELRT